MSGEHFFDVDVYPNITLIFTPAGDMLTKCVTCGASIIQRHGRGGEPDDVVNEICRVARERIEKFSAEHKACVR